MLLPNNQTVPFIGIKVEKIVLNNHFELINETGKQQIYKCDNIFYDNHERQFHVCTYQQKLSEKLKRADYNIWTNFQNWLCYV